MTEPVTSAEVEAAYAALDDVTRQLSEKNVETEQLYEQRRKLFKQLLDLGVAQAAIARHCGLSPMAVAFAVNEDKSTKPRRKKRTA